MKYPVTPDGRYFVVRGRLWRCTNPDLPVERQAELTKTLMDARRNKGRAMRTGDAEAREGAQRQIQIAKVALGERGAVWWTDGAQDWDRNMVQNTPYADWFAGLLTGKKPLA